MDAPRPLAGRYTFAKRFRGTARTIIWLARDSKTGRDVIASVVPPPRATGLTPLIGVTHEHAATLLDVLEHPAREEVPGEEPLADDARVAVAEYVPGRSLQERLDTSPISVEDAVQWLSSVAAAVGALHDAGGVHGAISPRALIATRFDRGPVPLLTHLVVPPSGAYCSPERVTGGGPSVADDVWALTATLYSALARRPPFQGASRTELARAIVRGSPATIETVDPELYASIEQGLSAVADKRFATAAALRAVLEEWLGDTDRRSLGPFVPVQAIPTVSESAPDVGDLSLVAALARPDSPESRAPLVVHRLNANDSKAARDDHHDDPAPKFEPVVARSILPKNIGLMMTTPPKRRSRSPVTAVALAGIVVVSAAAGMFAAKLRRGSRQVATPTPSAVSAAPNAPASAAPVELAPQEIEPTTAPASASAEALATASASASAGSSATPEPSATTSAAAPAGASASPNDCVARTLTEGTFGKVPDVAFLCGETDLWKLARRLNMAVAQHGVGEGMVLWAHLGRFDLAATSLMRQRCCPNAAPLVVATPKGICETLTTSTIDVGRDPSKVDLDHYDTDIACLITHQVRYPSDWWDRVGPKDARAAFERLVASLTPR
jgi:serine/threonine protein kinase